MTDKEKVIRKAFGTPRATPENLTREEVSILFEVLGDYLKELRDTMRDNPDEAERAAAEIEYNAIMDRWNTKELEKIISIVPKNAAIPVSKIAQNAPDLINGVIPGVYVDKNKTQGATLTLETDGLTLPENFTKYDSCIHNAICSLIEAGNTNFTAEMVYRAMNGLTDSEKVTEEAAASVTRAIRKMRLMNITIDYSEQAKTLHENAASLQITDYIIPCKIVEGETLNGYKKQVFSLTGKPPIYDYSQHIGHIRTLPIKLLNIKGLRSSEQTTIVRDYLLTQIELMKRGRNPRSRTILYKKLFEDCGLDFKPVLLKRYRGYIEKMLLQWIDQKYIKGFKEGKDGRSFTKLIIEL